MAVDCHSSFRSLVCSISRTLHPLPALFHNYYRSRRRKEKKDKYRLFVFVLTLRGIFSEGKRKNAPWTKEQWRQTTFYAPRISTSVYKSSFIFFSKDLYSFTGLESISQRKPLFTRPLGSLNHNNPPLIYFTCFFLLIHGLFLRLLTSVHSKTL